MLKRDLEERAEDEDGDEDDSDGTYCQLYHLWIICFCDLNFLSNLHVRCSRFNSI